ncbi:MAG: NAD(P)-binding domain-containing protein, partial [bacterium]|nr:NAD(P)-binding domain-containing protein [bacterium]
ISGGEQGALNGPSIMPSGNETAYQKVKLYLENISARDSDGVPCCGYVGKEGSGHFVKMVHNGIEYVEMQLLAECYAILKRQGLTNEEIANVLESWKSDLESYLLGITIDILRKKEGDDYLLDKILDKAGNKGTGNWTTVAIADSGEPATMVPAALFARYLSYFKDRRMEMSALYSIKNEDVEISVSQLKDAYQFSRIINHYQGFSFIETFSVQNNWDVNLSEVARIWTEGCIIKSDLMKELVVILKSNSAIISDSRVINLLKSTYFSAREIAITCLKNHIHVPCILEAVNFFNGLQTAELPANLIQAQRDYFGAHTYQRVDDSINFHHTIW